MLSGRGANSCNDRCTVMKPDLKWKPLRLPQDLILELWPGDAVRVCVCVKCMTMMLLYVLNNFGHYTRMDRKNENFLLFEIIEFLFRNNRNIIVQHD